MLIEHNLERVAVKDFKDSLINHLRKFSGTQRGSVLIILVKHKLKIIVRFNHT
jgi:hypothetical protein